MNCGFVQGYSDSMDDELPPLALPGRPPGTPRDKAGRYLSQPKSPNVTTRGNGRAYIVRRLSRDGRFDLVAMVRRREMSAYAAARKAGWGGPPRTHRAPSPPTSASPVPVRVDVKALVG